MALKTPISSKARHAPIEKPCALLAVSLDAKYWSSYIDNLVHEMIERILDLPYQVFRLHDKFGSLELLGVWIVCNRNILGNSPELVGQSQYLLRRGIHDEMEEVLS